VAMRGEGGAEAHEGCRGRLSVDERGSSTTFSSYLGGAQQRDWFLAAVSDCDRPRLSCDATMKYVQDWMAK
jgi:hypothetical protein